MGQFSLRMSKAQPTVTTDAAPWMTHIEKLPPQMQAPLKTWCDDVLSKPNETHVRSMAIAQTLLMLWAVSSAPWFAIIGGVAATAVPEITAKYILLAGGLAERQVYKAIPPMMAGPAIMGGIVALNFLTYVSYYLDWIVCLLWMTRAAYFAAKSAVATWQKEQRTAKEGDEEGPPTVSPGGSLHKD